MFRDYWTATKFEDYVPNLGRIGKKLELFFFPNFVFKKGYPIFGPIFRSILECPKRGYFGKMDQEVAILGKIAPKLTVTIFAKIVIFDFRKNENSLFWNQKIGPKKSTTALWFLSKTNDKITSIWQLSYFFCLFAFRVV